MEYFCYGTDRGFNFVLIRLRFLRQGFQMILSATKCCFELCILFALVQNLVSECVGEIEIVSKIREKFAKSSEARFCNFSRIFETIEISPTHEATKFYTSKNKMHSEKQHLRVDGIFCHYMPCLKYQIYSESLSESFASFTTSGHVVYKGVTRPDRSTASGWPRSQSVGYQTQRCWFESHRGQNYFKISKIFFYNWRQKFSKSEALASLVIVLQRGMIEKTSYFRHSMPRKPAIFSIVCSENQVGKPEKTNQKISAPIDQKCIQC